MSAAAKRPSSAATRRGPLSAEVMVFCRTGWEDPLAEFNERLRALFAVGRAGERELIDMVSAYFRLTRAEMVGARGARRVAQARHIAMYICRRELGTSTGALGRLFQRDPTSVLHAAQQVAARIAKDADFAAEIAVLTERWRKCCT